MLATRRRPLAVGVALVASLALASAPAQAQFETTAPAISLEIGTSVRSAAMAGAGAAVLWGEPDPWSNPATLSSLRGVSWVQGHANLNPSLSHDIVFDSQQLLIGGAGIGVSSMGQPFSGLGHARFEVPLTIDTGFGPESFSLFEKTESFGVGISPLRLLDALRASSGSSQARLTDVGEFAVGYQTERTEGGLDPGFAADFPETYDWGVSGRLALGRLAWPEAPFRLDVAAAYSDLNHVHGSSDSPSGFRRAGVAIHGSPKPPAERASTPASQPWWRSADVPEFSATLAYDHDLRAFGTDANIDRVGFEAEMLDLLALRVGYLSDPDGQIHGATYGGGVTLPIGPWGSVSYQLASEPLVEGVDRRFRQGFSVWLDPARIWADTQRR